jgi:hypothetical protein
VPVKPLNPAVERYDLGHLLLWQDDLAAIVELIRRLDGVSIRIEADGNLIDEAADLPQLGPRIGYLTVAAERPGGKECLKLSLSKQSSEITTTDADLAVEGVAGAIQRFTAGHRRVPYWMRRFFRWGTSPNEISLNALPLPLIAVCFVAEIIGVSSVASRHDHGASAPTITWPASLIVVISLAVVLVGLIVCQFVCRTLMFSGTRGQAPTWWMGNRASIVIGVVTAAVFLWLGHLWH